MNSSNSENAIISSILLYFLTQGVLLAIVYIIALFNNDIMNLFISNNLMRCDYE